MPDRELLCQAINRALPEALASDDQGYWVIRRMHLPFRADPRFGVQGLAEEFASVLRQRVLRILRGEVVEGVRRYASRAHWLAECLWAQSNGDATDDWRFARYRHHSLLPPPSAVRLTVLDEAPHALAAFSLLIADRRLEVLGLRLGEIGTRGVLTALTATRSVTVEAVDVELLRELAREAERARDRPNLAMLLALARFHADHADAPIPTVERLRRALRSASASRPRQLPSVEQPVASRGAANLPDTVRPAVSDRATTGGREASLDQSSRLPRPLHSPVSTPYAGVFALWRSVCELELPALLQEGAAGAPARLALAAALTGPDHASAWHDRALHQLTGYYPEPGEPAPTPDPDLAERFLLHYRERNGYRGIEPSLSPAGRLHVLQDRHSEDWLALGSYRQCLTSARAFDAALAAPRPDARDPTVDLDWFGVRHRRERRPWALLARAAYGDFSRRLHGLAGSSAAWLWPRLLAGWGVLEPGASATLHLPRVPLDLVLRMGGLDGARLETPGGEVRLALPDAE